MLLKTRAGLLSAAALWLMPITATGQESQAETQPFVLGTIIVTAEGEQGRGGTSSTVTGEEIARQNRVTLDDALRSVPGVAVGNTGGSRNERLVHVRGFDRFQVPVSIDGIRVYLPADNRLDYGRFLTPDLSEIQVQKGYVSVLNGPGGMGGAINLVTRQPSAPFEGEARIGLEAGNRGDITARTGFLSLGSRQQDFWLQGSYLKRDNDGFYLSRDYTPRPQQGAGLRDHSDTDDSRLNLKAGWTPNATDEYVFSYTRQTGAKKAPYNVDQPIRGITDEPGPGQSWQRDWTWPEWDLDSLAFYSHTELGGGYLKTRAYYNRFDNLLSAWDDSSHGSQTERRAFDSRYKDRAWGLSLEGGAELGAANTLRGALHYRRDRHDSIQHNQPDLGGLPDTPERSEEETWSLALENTWQARAEFSVIAGISYDKASVLKADRTVDDAGLPTGSSDAVNWQLAAIWQPEAGGEFHASLSSRTRFPTLWNRYSTRFGTAVPNPDLKSERALNVEIGYGGEIGPARVQTALFYSKVDDMIQSVPVGPDLTQSQNVGDGTYKGFEIEADWQLGDRLGLVANYTWLQRGITDPVRADYRPTDTPRHTAFLRLDWQALDRLTVSPSVEVSGARLSESAIQPEDPTQIAYTRMGGFGLANLDFDWQATDRTSVVFGIRNLFDRDYQLVEGYPEPGRSFFLTTRVAF
ncbi:TonB-dependent receptor plug domain-containing protein [Paracoccus siganidrum]|uniref:TonB-dependent receptor n=2 Tax=Paracoccus siganidrum TaxID=1276757 RepID=A0A419AB69_9RHOB|nr:TonB-dependent receptor [Paracoccus siganidrum]RJL20600.1 TonB-dependent receptor [Paracoccus siganidrum]RMC38345.1 TonB-dependent receptor [Paracoccus siganidrum]